MDDLLREQNDAYKEMGKWTKKAIICTVAVLFGCIAFAVNIWFLNPSVYLLTTIVVFYIIFLSIGIHADIQATKQKRRFWKANVKYKLKLKKGERK